MRFCLHKPMLVDIGIQLKLWESIMPFSVMHSRWTFVLWGMNSFPIVVLVNNSFRVLIWLDSKSRMTPSSIEAERAKNHKKPMTSLSPPNWQPTSVKIAHRDHIPLQPTNAFVYCLVASVAGCSICWIGFFFFFFFFFFFLSIISVIVQCIA